MRFRQQPASGNVPRVKPLLILVIAILCEIGIAQDDLYYTIQVASIPASNATSKASTLTKLQNDGWRPVHAISEGDSIKVCIGVFETIADAQWWKKAIQGSGYPDAFMKKTPTLPRAAGPTVGPVKSMFEKPEHFAASDQEAVERVRSGLAADKQRYFDRLAGATPADAAEIVAAWKPLADGRVTGSKAEIAHARRAIAHVYHYGPKRNWLNAYQAYGEALAISEPGSENEAQCLLERSALLLELSRSGKSNFAEVRKVCKASAAQVSKGNIPVQSVLALMHAESWFYEGKHKEALDEFLSIPSNYPSRRREALAARTWTGICQYELGNYEQAEIVLRAIIAEDISLDDQFAHKGKPADLKRQAAIYLGNICSKRNDLLTAQLWDDFARARKMDPSTPLPQALEVR